MLSRLLPADIEVIDTDNYVEPQTGTVTWTLPLQYDEINKEDLSVEQFAECAQDPDKDEYNIQDVILFSCKRPGPRQA